MAIYDDGVYLCRAVNSFGSDEHQIQVVVSGLEPAEVSTSQSNISAIVGESCVLQCAASGKPEPEIYWTKGLQKIMPNVGSNLKLQSVTETDSGVYICHAVNSAGEGSVSVTVDIWIPAKITTTGQTFNILEGDPVQMACDVYGNPRATTEWAHNGEIISQMRNDTDQIEHIETPSGLVLSGVSRMAAGIWTCHALNEAGSDSVSHELVVEWAPTSRVNDITYAVQTVTLGETVHLKCSVDAKPAPVFTWSHNGDTIPSHGSTEYFIDHVSGSMTIERVSLHQSGIFTCQARVVRLRIK